MILDLCPYWTNPTTGGGPERVHHLCQSVSRVTRVTEVSFRPTLTIMRSGVSPLRSNRISVNANYLEIQIPHVPSMMVSRGVALAGLPQDLLLSQSCSIMTPAQVRELASSASSIQIEHPWQFMYAQRLSGEKKPLILSTHNCEAKLFAQEKRKQISKKTNGVLNRVESIESVALAHADHVLAVSEEDIADFANLLGVDVRHKATVIPNGVDCTMTKPPTPEERIASRLAIGAGDETVALFLGTRHAPNIEAIRTIKKMLPNLDKMKIRFFVVGSAGEGMMSQDNLIFSGHVPDYRPYLRAADIALNPLTSGSGTSLKILEYLAAGIPVVTTPIGARGLNVKDGLHVAVSSIEDFPHAVANLAGDERRRERLSSEGRTLVEREYDWRVIGEKYTKMLTRLGFVERCDECAT